MNILLAAILSQTQSVLWLLSVLLTLPRRAGLELILEPQTGFEHRHILPLLSARAAVEAVCVHELLQLLDAHLVELGRASYGGQACRLQWQRGASVHIGWGAVKRGGE